MMFSITSYGYIYLEIFHKLYTDNSSLSILWCVLSLGYGQTHSLYSLPQREKNAFIFINECKNINSCSFYVDMRSTQMAQERSRC